MRVDSGTFSRSFVPAAHMLRVLDAAFGSEWTSWEPETLWEEISRRWGVVGTPSDSVRASIQAGKTLRENREAYETDLNGFEDITIGLNGIQPDFQTIEVCSPGEILLGYAMAQLCVAGDFTFSPSVISYVRGCFRSAGVYAYPAPLLMFEPDQDKETRDKIRKLAETWAHDQVIDHDSMVSVQAAKLHDVYAHSISWSAQAKVKEAMNAE